MSYDRPHGGQRRHPTATTPPPIFPRRDICQALDPVTGARCTWTDDHGPIEVGGAVFDHFNSRVAPGGRGWYRTDELICHECGRKPGVLDSITAIAGEPWTCGLRCRSTMLKRKAREEGCPHTSIEIQPEVHYVGAANTPQPVIWLAEIRAFCSACDTVFSLDGATRLTPRLTPTEEIRDVNG